MALGERGVMEMSIAEQSAQPVLPPQPEMSGGDVQQYLDVLRRRKSVVIWFCILVPRPFVNSNNIYSRAGKRRDKTGHFNQVNSG